ncbi:MAG TPA: VIT and VWA domain-containing protein [Drouetiella sp.]
MSRLACPPRKQTTAANKVGKFLLVNTTLMALFSAWSPALTLPSAIAASTATSNTATSSKDGQSTSGAGTMLAMSATGQTVGQCPLKHTSVSTKISGYVARVTVKQSFSNPFSKKIEAVYTFPLSESGAVDSMTMKIGNRVIKGTIKKREEAKQIYDQAKANGHVASLLDQERSNIFTQSVANIEPGQSIDVTITYVELLKYESGKFTYTFPTVVGPRFIPGDTAVGKSGTGRTPDTDKVPDGSKITPPVTPQNTRAGHDISIDVDIDSGIPISNISSKLHEVTVENVNKDEAKVSLKDKDAIPNKDFVLTWDVAGDALKSGYLTHRDAKNESGYFTLMLMPPKRVAQENVAPKKMIFLIDCSGSQEGAPLQKAKDTLRYIVDHMNPQDTFQIIAFSDTAKTLYSAPQAVNGARKIEANNFINKLYANGGTWMAPAVQKALATPADGHRLRIVTFMTDGYVGNDYEILSLIKKRRDTSRWFSFGTGNGVNRELIDGIAAEGGGEADYVLLNSSAAEVGKKFYDRISTPVMTDVSVDYGKLDVKEVYPREVNDVWAEKPLYFKGRYTKAGAGTVTLKGYVGGKLYTQTLNVTLPEINHDNEVLGAVWARAKVDRLMSEDYLGVQSGNVNKELRDEIVKTALDHHIMTNYTSFVAVEEKTVTKGGEAQTVTVPVEMPDGVSRDGVFGAGDSPSAIPAPARARFGGGGGAGASNMPMRRQLMANGGGLTSGKAQLYTSPKQLQIVSEQPIINDFRTQSNLGANYLGLKKTAAKPVPMKTRELGDDAAIANGEPKKDEALRQSTDKDQQKSAAHKSRNEQEETKKGTQTSVEGKSKTGAELQSKNGTEPQSKNGAQKQPKFDTQLQELVNARNAKKPLPVVKGCDGTSVKIEINLQDASEANLKKLKELGFVLETKTGKKVVGKIKIDDLNKLAALSFVTSIKHNEG